MKNVTIMGAIVGDTIGSIYEFDSIKDYHFPILDERMEFTDDSIMTIAVADWILNSKFLHHKELSTSMRYWGNKYRYPMGGYGGMFTAWLYREEIEAYNSWGNGSAMRVSPVGFAFETLEETLRVAKISAEVTHNHPEGIKGAQAVAAAIFMARKRMSKEDIREFITKEFEYNLNCSYDEIRETYQFEDSCQETVPQALIAFLDSTDYEDAIRLTVSMGGDADTMGAITGAVSAAFYNEIPDYLYDFAMSKMPNDLRNVVELFNQKYLK